MRRIVRCFLILLAVLTAAPMPSLAAGAPLLMLLGDGTHGDIFSYTSSVGLKNLTSYGANSIPVLSPDGKQIAYASEVKQSGPAHSGPLPRNIWLMDAATGNAKRIAFQPADQAPDKNGIVPYIARSEPVWSPDGKALAWMEQRVAIEDDGATDHLMILDVVAGKNHEIYSQPVFCAGGPCTEVTWTQAGLGVIGADTPDGPFTLKVLSPKGKTLFQSVFEQSPDIHWVTGESEPTVITSNEVVRVRKDEHLTKTVDFEVYSLSAPEGLRFTTTTGFGFDQWTLTGPDVDPITLTDVTSIAIAPDGKTAAYATENGTKLFIFDGKKSASVGLAGVKLAGISPIQVNGLTWSALGLRFKPKEQDG